MCWIEANRQTFSSLCFNKSMTMMIIGVYEVELHENIVFLIAFDKHTNYANIKGMFLWNNNSKAIYNKNSLRSIKYLLSIAQNLLIKSGLARRCRFWTIG